MNKITIKIENGLFTVKVNGKELIVFGEICVFAGIDCEKASFAEHSIAFEIYNSVNYARILNKLSNRTL